MQKDIKMTIIIPSYNSSLYVIETIESVIAQTYKNIEILVIDDGSTDNTRLLLYNYIKNGKIKYIYKENGGVSVARNTGIENATGDVIAFLDADDVLLPTSVEKRIRAFELFPEAQVVFTDYYEEKFPMDKISFIKGTYREKDLLEYSVKTNYEYMLLKENFQKYFNDKEPCVIWTGAIAIRKATLDYTGYFKPELKLSEDIDLWRRLIMTSRIAYVNEPLVRYLSYRGTFDKYEKHYIENIKVLNDKINSPEDVCYDINSIKKTISDSYLAIAYKKYIPMLDMYKARFYILKSLEFNKLNTFAWRQLVLCSLPVPIYMALRRARCSFHNIKSKTR